MSSPIGVVGAGAIGCFVGGALAQTSGHPVILLGRQRLKDSLASDGLSIQNLSDPARTVAADRYRVTCETEELRDCGILLFCVKSKDTAEAAQALAKLVSPACLVVSLQNGLQNPAILREHFSGDVVAAGIVDFNVRELEGGRYHKTTSGGIRLESKEVPALHELRDDLQRAGVETELSERIVDEQWTKLLVNLNNAVSALTDAPTRELVAQRELRLLIAEVIAEGYRVAKASGAKPARLRGVPVSWMPSILRLPDFLAHRVTRAQMKIDPNARSSMWEDLRRGRTTEVDMLNGEVVRRAREHGISVPVNQRIVDEIHRAEERGQGSPRLSASELLAQR